MVTRSSGKSEGSLSLTDSLCLMINHRPLLSTMWDGRIRESCNRFKSGIRLSRRVSAVVASANFRDLNFLMGSPTLDSTGDAGRLRELLRQGVHE
jgi:hypothetical protein